MFDEPINVRLVREVIQNSLDAAIDKSQGSPRGSSGPVRVRFSLAGIAKPMSDKQAEAYFFGLEPHLQKTPDLEDDVVTRLRSGSLVAGGVPYLVIEDDRTTGLNGKWDQDDDGPEQPAEGNDFYWFFRNVGRSGKGESDNGSWGLGKWVIPDASKVSAYIAVTRRSEDNDVLLMGQAVLNKHTINGERFFPYGYYAEHDANGFQRPPAMSDPERRPFIRQCMDDFDLRYRNAPGLSVIVPFPRVDGGNDDDYLDKNGLLAAVVHNYFYPIISGYLQVTVDGDGPSEHLDSSNLGDKIFDLDLSDSGERSAEGYSKLFRMCRYISNLQSDEYIDLDARRGFQEGTQAHSDLVALRPRYEAGDLLAFRITTEVRRKDKPRESTSYNVYLQRDPALNEGHDYYVRGTLSIPNIDLIRSYPARALLVVNEDEPLAALLRDSEPPSHNSWRSNFNIDRVRKNWTGGPARITSVRGTPATILRILEAAPDGLQRDALADIFSWDGNWGQKTAPVPVPNVIQDPSSNPIVTPKRPESLPPPRQTDLTASRLGTGFRVSGATGREGSDPFRARLEVAYAIPNGNPFKKYRELDFRLHGEESLEVTVTGGGVSPGSAGNVLFLDVADPNQFSLTVQGFDHLRDVRVKVDRLVPDSTGKEE